MFEFVRPDWQDQAECNGVTPDLWFPDTQGDAIVTVRAAKAICNRCPVRIDCLNYALDNGIAYGVWGGATVLDRRKIRKQRAQGLRGVA